MGLLICPAANNGHRTNNPPLNEEIANRDGLNERPPHGGLPDFKLFAITTRISDDGVHRRVRRDARRRASRANRCRHPNRIPDGMRNRTNTSRVLASHCRTSNTAFRRIRTESSRPY